MTEVPVAEIVAKLQEVLRGNPPPWLRKAMNKDQPASFWKIKNVENHDILSGETEFTDPEFAQHN